MIFVWQLAVLELDGLALGQERELHRLFAQSFFGDGAGAL